MRSFTWSVVVIVLGLGVAAARAQDAAPAPAHIAFVDGSAMLNRNGQVNQAVANMPFVPGDHLRTTSGRVDILFPDGTALDVDQFTEVALDSETVVRLSEGRALLRVPNARYSAARYELLTPATSIVASGPGEYRLSYPDAYETARADDFERWVDAQTQAERSASASAQYLPPDLRTYGPQFDRYGGWQYDSSYGYVWYPTVAPTWRPYYDGYWDPVPTYGWTWIGVDAWSWPTHHYGRWGWRHERWFWIPARSWAPAWVAWGAATDYVSWCPLGWDSRPVFALSYSYGDPWLGWTVLRRDAFGYGYGRVSVAGHLVDPGRVHVGSTPFIVQNRAPIAVPRTIASDGMPGGQRARSRTPYSGQTTAQTPGTAVSRGGTPFYQIHGDRRETASGYRGQVPAQGSGSAVPRYATPAYRNVAPTTSAPIDRRRVPSAPSAGLTQGPAYRAPAFERPRVEAPQRLTPYEPSSRVRPYEPQSRVAPYEPQSRVAPYQPQSRVTPYEPQSRVAPYQPQSSPQVMPRQEPNVRPMAPPAQPMPPMARPQAQPRAEPSGGGRQAPPPSQGEAQGSGQRRRR